MPNVQVRDVPEVVREALVRRAELGAQSPQQYLSAQLSAIASTPTLDEMIDRIEDVPRVASPDTTQALPSKPNVLVVDASVIASFVADGGPGGDKVRARLRGESIAGPDLLRVEVMSVIRASPMPGPSR